MKYKSGFTLIELLIVILVIALLATAGIAFLQQAREDGRIAALLQFSDGIKISLGSNLVSYWSFDNGSGTDSWGQNHGTIYGAISVEGVVGNALYFDGQNDYIKIPSSSSLPNDFVKNNNWTFEAWIKPTMEGNDDYEDIFEGVYHSPRIAIIQSYGTLLLAGYTPNYRNIVWKNNIITNKWQHIVISAEILDGSTANYKLYHNGKKVFDGNSYRITGKLNSSNRYLIAGRQVERFEGIIEEVKIYSEVLSYAQIQKNYAEGAKKFDIAAK